MSIFQCVLTNWLYKLSLPVVSGERELVMNINLFPKIKYNVLLTVEPYTYYFCTDNKEFE